MTDQELELEQNVHIENLDGILKAWRSPARKMKKLSVYIVVLIAIVAYFVAYNLYGNRWGYLATTAALFAGFFCIDQFERFFKVEIWSDEKFAYQACLTMENLIAIKEGTYEESGAHILTDDKGRHYKLYKKFIQMYPEYQCRDLKKISKIEIESEDLHS